MSIKFMSWLFWVNQELHLKFFERYSKITSDLWQCSIMHEHKGVICIAMCMYSNFSAVIIFEAIHGGA